MPEQRSHDGMFPRRRRLRWTLAAAVTLLLATGAVWIAERVETQTISTAVGQMRRVTLADGSVITLNTNSIVRTDMRFRARDVHLQKGEAHFQVAHDASRPFLVHAGDTVVRAVGTQFDVRLHADHEVDVMVNEGRVEVQSVQEEGARNTALGSRSRRLPVQALHAGQRLSMESASREVLAVTPSEMSNAMAWRDGAIVFDGQPLSRALAELSRYTDITIVINDPKVAGLLVGGRFETDDLQSVFAALQDALPVTIHSTANGIVYVEARR
jgi:transmembrane sensor